MVKRVVWGSLGAILGITLIWAGGIWFSLGIGLLATLGVLEYAELLKRQNLRPQTEVMLFTSLLLLALIYFGGFWGVSTAVYEKMLIIMLVVVFFVTLINELLRDNPEQGLINAAVNLFGAVYIGFMLAYILMLRFLPGGDGFFYVLFTVLVTWANDTFAYFIGINFGKHKLSPRISPKKSVEGSIGGLIGGLLGAIILGFVFHKSFMIMVILGAIVVMVGQFGDLIESIIKRNAGVKDSGSFLPGHGGVLDRFDSMLLAAPVVYYFVVYGLPHL